MRRYLTLFGALAALGVARPVQAASDVSVAVLGLETVDAPQSLAQQLTDALRQRAAATSGVRQVQGKDLIEVKMVFGCDGELPACMAQAGKTLGTDKLLYGAVKKGPSKTTVTVSLKLLDVKTAIVEKFVNDTVPKRELSTANVHGVATRWFSQLVEIETKPTLSVTSEPAGAGVTVDGQSYGRTPLTLRDLAPGTHTVVLTLPGRQTVQRVVELRAGGTHDVVATLEPEAPVMAPKPPVERAPEPQPLVTPAPLPPPRPPAAHAGRTAKILGGVLAGAAVVTAGVAIYTWRTYTDLQDRAHADLEAIKQTPIPADQQPFFSNPSCNGAPSSLVAQNPAGVAKFQNDCSSGNTFANATTGLWVATGALAAAGVVSFVVGDRQAAKAKERNIGVMRQTLRVAPVFSTRGGGLTAAFEF